MLLAVTDDDSVPFIPFVPAVEADHVEKKPFAVDSDCPVKVPAEELVLEPPEAAFQENACRVDVASFAPVVPGSVVFRLT